MRTTLQNIIGGHGILVSQIAGQFLIELDTSIMGPVNSDAPIGILDEATMTLLTYATEHDSSPDTRQWSTDLPNTGMKLTVQTATIYDASGDHVLYSMVRDLSFDSLGKLANVSAERQVVIDITENCS